MTVLRRALFTALLALTATGPAVAQMQSGSILVRVTDDQGQAAAGAAVSIYTAMTTSPHAPIPAVTASGRVGRPFRFDHNPTISATGTDTTL